MSRAASDLLPEAVAALQAGWSMTGYCTPLGEGHIHDTWLVDSGSGLPRHVLQRMSGSVFADSPGLMQKIVRVIEHVTERRASAIVSGKSGDGLPDTPPLVPTKTRAPGYADTSGCYWRLWGHVGNSRTLQRLETPAQALAAGRAFGQMQAWLRDLPGILVDPIPGFMQLDHYLDRLDTVRSQQRDSQTETPQVSRWLREIDARRSLASLFRERNRIIHGDCKVNNLLFAADSDRVICVLDLDTIMHGHWAWDAGDLMRSGATDDSGLSLGRLTALVRGLREAGGIEADTIDWVLAPRYVTLMLATRFLTDHLEGDVYFRVSARGENLARAAAQFDVLFAFERAEQDMVGAVEAALGNPR